MTKLEKSKVRDIVFDQVMVEDYPDFVDAYIISAKLNERNLTEEEIEELNQDSCFISDEIIKQMSLCDLRSLRENYENKKSCCWMCKVELAHPEIIWGICYNCATITQD